MKTQDPSAPRPIFDGPGPPPPGSSEAYRALLERLYALAKSGTHLGLAAIARVLGALGHPERAAPSVHVAGSNGKGSTSAFLAAILSDGGAPVGLYTSPHLISLTERVQVVRGAVPSEVEQEALARALAAVEAVAPGFGELSFFEAITAAGLWSLAESRVEAAVVEAGLGARLDATRLVEAQVAVLTDLSLEHTNILGETIEEIAAEEGAVMRGGRPLVMADGPPAAMQVVDAMAREAGAEVFRIGAQLHLARHADGTFDLDLGAGRVLERVSLSLLGPHQGRNALLAAKAATLFDPGVTDLAIRRGLGRARWPGRMEIFRPEGGPPVLLDGAHNAHGAEVLAAALLAHRELFDAPLHFVFGALADKDASAMVAALEPLARSITFTRPGSPRARAPEALRAMAISGVVTAVEEGTLAAYEAARAAAARDGGWVVVAGSLYLVGDVRAALLPSR